MHKTCNAEYQILQNAYRKSTIGIFSSNLEYFSQTGSKILTVCLQSFSSTMSAKVQQNYLFPQDTDNVRLWFVIHGMLMD